jgi:predicted RNA-binding protein with PIN domain
LTAARYLVDGDNLIGAWGGPHPHDDRRAEVVRRVAAVCRRDAATAHVVFDPTRAAVATEDTAVVVEIAPPGRSADDVIRDVVDATPAAALTVVTSDKPLYSYARTRGASVLRAHEWNALERRH